MMQRCFFGDRRTVYEASCIVDRYHEEATIFDCDDAMFVLYAEARELDIGLGANDAATTNISAFLEKN